MKPIWRKPGELAQAQMQRLAVTVPVCAGDLSTKKPPSD
jgi:hypothetical protein